MPADNSISRRSLFGFGLFGVGAAATALGIFGRDAVSGSASGVGLLDSAENATRTVQRLLLDRTALAPEFSEAEVAPTFRANGSTDPTDADYVALRDGGFKDWRLEVAGLVDKPLSLSLDDLKAMPQRTQITRHDCVEGWSCVGKWTGVPLSHVLDLAGVKPGARYCVFRCLDTLEQTADGNGKYYESVDFVDARHPQTILAHGLNGGPLPVANGAPLRLRVERQLGYKQAKYIKRIEVAADFAGVEGGKGGFWEDRGYEWYAGI
ncbi:MAG: molybdopterin-binding protein [Hyphomicrobiales bacterium]|nr:molybdopterin-binding protein [Hyphomicrobiales bacterium]MDE2016487.1 molybdopterin-binding protein [Hyphomicrobiales bacterium]